MNFKSIHIGQMIEMKVAESGIEISRICNFLRCTPDEIQNMYKAKSLDTEILLRWSKLLGYDFFRIYTQHLILYTSPAANTKELKAKKTSLPQFRKNIYTIEVIEFILGLIKTRQKTKIQVIEEYNTLYRWISKYGMGIYNANI